MSSRSSPMVSLSKSIQRVTNREAVGVLQGQRLANSQYDDNSTLAFSFPEETDSPWQPRPKMFAYFCSNKFLYRKYAVWPRLCVFPFAHAAHPRKILINMAFQCVHMHEIRQCLSYTNVPFCTISFCPFHFVLQMSSEVRPCSQPVGVADVFNGTRFVSWW